MAIEIILTEREREVLQCLVDQNGDYCLAAKKLHISVSTVKTHVDKCCLKLFINTKKSCNRLMSLILKAYSMNLVEIRHPEPVYKAIQFYENYQNLKVNHA